MKILNIWTCISCFNLQNMFYSVQIKVLVILQNQYTGGTKDVSAATISKHDLVPQNLTFGTISKIIVQQISFHVMYGCCIIF
ncbi:hypothetical protein BpHYR1_032033 [Brachionus plicatilis]|uniref:Uncharacterized protein n=1 Tax=Brachionus plicatilis TaxID=10195 RepID=A0A3M7RFY6_BRAPC|nr:hypothetical protein BpHYR1_032033 [Brachionus plicatilis]